MTSHYTELINLKSAPNNPQGLRNLYNEIERHLRSLKALAQDTEQEVYIYMITAKMLMTFGSEKPRKTESRNTKLDIVVKDGSTLTINANVVPHIAESIQRRPVNSTSLDNWDYLWAEFSLADDLPKERETSSVEQLIGNDYYLDIILPQKVTVQPGLYLLGSKLGWILSGQTSERAEEPTAESTMLTLMHGKVVNTETSFLTCQDKSLPKKPNLEDFGG